MIFLPVVWCTCDRFTKVVVVERQNNKIIIII